MKTFIYEFEGLNPVGAFMYVRAKDRDDADMLFKEFLPAESYGKNVHCGNIQNYNYGKLTDAVTVTEIKPGRGAYVISDGDY